MSKHTPGPWHANYAGGAARGQEFKISEYFVYAPDTQDDVGICGDVIDPLTQEPSEANARLIAAAPELLEALQMVHDSTAVLNHLDSDAQQFICDVIAKATLPE